METITIPKKEYQKLVDAKLRYEYLRQMVNSDIFAPPPLRNRKTIIKAFETTKRYNAHFLKSLKNGLQRSSYFK